MNVYINIVHLGAEWKELYTTNGISQQTSNKIFFHLSCKWSRELESNCSQQIITEIQTFKYGQYQQ